MSFCARTPPARLPMMPRSTWVRWVIGTAYVTPGAGTPTCTQMPPQSRQRTAESVTAGCPTHSKLQLTPPPPNGPSAWVSDHGTNSRICSTASPSLALMKWVAPSFIARSFLDSSVSTAMILPAALMRSAWITDSPTPPAPKTAVLSPGITFARLNTEPMPVTTPQAIRQAEVSGTDLSIGTACTSLMIVRSAKDDVAAKLPPGCPPMVNGSDRLPIDCLHQVGWPALQRSHRPQLATVPITMWSPGLPRVTSDPTASTIPAPS